MAGPVYILEAPIAVKRKEREKGDPRSTHSCKGKKRSEAPKAINGKKRKGRSAHSCKGKKRCVSWAAAMEGPP